MKDLTRRNAVKWLAGGSVLAGGTVLSTAKPSNPAMDSQASPPQVPAVAREAETGPRPPEASRILLAEVLRCRSWDASVYLAAEGIAGYAQLTPHAYAIAAACQASGRRVAMRYGGHEPLWAQGAGLFHAVVLAIDPTDFDTEGDVWQ